MKRILLVFLICFLILPILGCESRSYLETPTEQPKTEVILNERQKTILAEQGLPTEYEQLPGHQQRAIVAIEEMLLYAEDKYGQPFSYAGYAPAGPMEPEQLQAYPSNGFMERDCFTVIRKKGQFQDDFLTVAVKPYFTSYLCDHFQKFLPDTEMKLYARITKTTLTEIPTEETNLDGKVAGAIYIFLDGETCSIEKANDFQAQVIDFLYEHQLYGMVDVVLLKAGKLDYLSEFNFIDYFGSDSCDSRQSISIQR